MHFETGSVQGHPRSLILVRFESAYATAYESSIEIFGFFAQTQILRVFPSGQIADVGAGPSELAGLISVKLFSMYSKLCDTVPHRHRQTDGQTDGQKTYRRIPALFVASRGKIP